jgi:glyoxylase-like metal-dependent hydrolase (beta-lactamase superfamily II)
MQVKELTPGLWRWTGRHPDWQAGEDWDEDVGCVYYEGPDRIALIDPLIPPEAPDRFLAALDRDVERLGRPVAIVLTCYWHRRSADDLAGRYGGTVWATDESANARDISVTGGVPSGIEAIEVPRLGEIVFWIPEHAALVPGDILLGDGSGGIRICPDSWLKEEVRSEPVRRALEPLLDLPVERVLLSHGEPVLSGARAALERALR